MELPPLTTGRILKRYKRFLSDIELDDGTVVTAHCPNTGSMAGCWEPGAPAQISYSDNPKRKLRWTLERIDMGQGWVGVNTSRTNAVVAEAISAGRVQALAGYAELTREVKFDAPEHPSSRIDLMLSGGDRPDALVEVKNVTLWDGERLRFPDAVSQRATKHLHVLRHAVKRGMRGVVLFALNRPEGECFSPAGDIDPVYAETLEEVLTGGVEAYALRIRHDQRGMRGEGMVPVVL
ncbi:DNA/RNA nuclease SfsA [Solemya velesiana gill symbiont]|uniref:Sugar fermentation stimulation protein homolog n=1 Tax=Solemya velesiana gill symbiont TaxID=1918948 RepID=A0A1T2KW02_9GAMM|nr:DNA/RNA nuclease SfsA [Solemya velesiana gill symbiont]OOZ36920.1 sugar fermentation stimulation protein SfsA [Solemya velesiana gill symbiont]